MRNTPSTRQTDREQRPIEEATEHGQPQEAEDQTPRTDRQRRGQTETLAALVAVVSVCLALSAYAVFLGDVFPELGEDRSLGEATADRVWDAVNHQGYYNSSRAVAESVGPEALPQGRSVAINVTYVGESGRIESVGNETFGPRGRQTELQPPASAERYERPVPIRLQHGDVRPGSLEVVVWA